MSLPAPPPTPAPPAAEAIALLAAPELPPPPRALRGACFEISKASPGNQHKIKAGKDHNHLDFTFDATVLAAPPSPLVRTIFELKTPTNVKLALGFTSITQCNIRLKTHRRKFVFSIEIVLIYMVKFHNVWEMNRAGFRDEDDR